MRRLDKGECLAPKSPKELAPPAQASSPFISLFSMGLIVGNQRERTFPSEHPIGLLFDPTSEQTDSLLNQHSSLLIRG